MGSEFDLISRDAQEALQEFSEEFSAALAIAEVDSEWAKAYGTYKPSAALKTTFPVPVSAALYKEFKGDLKYRSLFEKSIELKPKTWQDGVAELASVIEAPDFIGWNEQPAAMAAEARRLPNTIIAEALEANDTCWDGLAFFHDSHLNNYFDSALGTFDNDITGAGTDPTLDNLAIAKYNFRAIKGPNGKPLGLRMTHVLVPPAQEEQWRNLLEQDLIIQANAAGSQFAAVDNRHKGTVQLVVCDEFTDDSLWYPLALNKPGMKPWVTMDQGAPEEIIQDKSDALYKNTLKVSIAYILRANGGLMMPHCVQRWSGTAP